MSRLISRILLSLLSLFGAAVVYLIIFLIGENYRRYGAFSDEWTFVLAGGVTWIALAAYWFLLWRRAIVWTRPRKTWTALSPFVALGVATAGGLLLSLSIRYSRELPLFVGSILAPIAWVMTIVYAWRSAVGETRESTAVVCPNCNYNLAGLSEARCPECGSAYTLDQLFAAQPSVVAAKQDREVT